MEKRTIDTILDSLTEIVAAKKSVPRELWLEAAFDLTLLRIEEYQLLNKMKQAVAQKKLEIMQAQEKKNVSAADLEVEATDEYRFMRDHESKMEAVEEIARIAKKSADLGF